MLLSKCAVCHSKNANLSNSIIKDLTRRTASDKILRDKAFNIIQNMMDINVDLLQ